MTGKLGKYGGKVGNTEGTGFLLGQKRKSKTEAEFFAVTVSREGRVSGRDVKGASRSGVSD